MGGATTWTDLPGANEARPINCITWFEAFAFCVWDGGRLPTEAEWNYAAAGGTEQRAYPWSSPSTDMTIDFAHAVFTPSGTPPYTPIANVGSTSPTGNAKWGHADMAGNMWDWNLDWFSGYPNPCVDCANLAPSPFRVLRGGSFMNDGPTQLVSFRSDGDPSARNFDIGMRCAR